MSLKRFFNRMRLGSALDKPGLEGETYLTRAVKNGDADTVREFLDLGADPDAKNKSGELPLHIALSVQNLKIMHMLLETGADIFKSKTVLRCANTRKSWSCTASPVRSASSKPASRKP